jgi:hypothetical protein
MHYLYQKDERALPGNLQNQRYSFLPPSPNVSLITPTPPTHFLSLSLSLSLVQSWESLYNTVLSPSKYVCQFSSSVVRRGHIHLRPETQTYQLAQTSLCSHSSVSSVYLFIFRLFNDAANNSDYTAWNGAYRKKWSWTTSETLSRNLSEGPLEYETVGYPLDHNVGVSMFCFRNWGWGLQNSLQWCKGLHPGRLLRTLQPPPPNLTFIWGWIHLFCYQRMWQA